MAQGSADTIGDTPAEPTLPEQREGYMQILPVGTTRIFADACVVEPISDAVEVTFLSRAARFSGLTWPDSSSQPSGVMRSYVVEELGKVRLTLASANDLALNLILEAAIAGDIDMAALERNFQILRDHLLQIKVRAGGD